MTQFPDILLLRHGQTYWNADNKMHGHLDSALTPIGHRQARAQNDALRRLDVCGCMYYTSPQGRAVKTARIAFDGLTDHIVEDNRLREIGIGGWAGRSRRDLESTLYGPSPPPHGALEYYDHAPDGEGFIALRGRCEMFLNALPAPAVIMTHGITCRMLRLVACDLPSADISDMCADQGVIYHIAKKHCIKM